MPLPLAHTLVGYSCAAASGVRFRRDTFTALLFSLVVANLPDVDFLPGALANEPVLYHRAVAHTLPAALLCGIIIGAVLTRFGKRFWEITLLGVLVYTSHLFADMVNFGGGNIGVQIFWPIDHGWYTLRTPWSDTDGGWLIFTRGRDSSGFFASFVSFQFARAMVMQALLFAPVLFIGWWIRWKRFAVSK
ncbi:MAG TPA: metal-dependent hydrolase [Longimicrobiales bacterium]|nr:metal-dependent hydrolase [Longimicrobiales bacterium]